MAEAVARFVHDGDYLASGGFGTNRIATAALHEIVRQKKRNLGFAGHTTTHDFQILAAGNMDGGGCWPGSTPRTSSAWKPAGFRRTPGG